MSSFKSIKKAFTLVEALVVMAIIVILMSIGAFGVLYIEDEAQLQRDFSEITGLVKTVRNMATNSVSFSGLSGDNEILEEVPYLYVIDFDTTENSYVIRFCKKEVGGDKNYICVSNWKDVLSSKIYENLEINGPCEMIGFKRVNGDIVNLGPLGSNFTEVTSLESCTLQFQHKESGKLESIKFDFVNNTVDFNL